MPRAAEVEPKWGGGFRNNKKNAWGKKNPGDEGEGPEKGEQNGAKEKHDTRGHLKGGGWGSGEGWTAPLKEESNTPRSDKEKPEGEVWAFGKKDKRERGLRIRKFYFQKKGRRRVGNG